jgi:hypothetical protein
VIDGLWHRHACMKYVLPLSLRSVYEGVLLAVWRLGQTINKPIRLSNLRLVGTLVNLSG